MKPRPDAIIVRTYAQRQSETLHTVILTAIPALLLGVAIMAAVHIGLTAFSDAKHESAQASIREADALLLRDCRKDLARLNEIKEAELAYLNRRPGP